MVRSLVIGVALGTAAIVTLSGIGYLAVQWLSPDEGAPNLTLREDFPAGFDRSEHTLRAVAFDGMDRCYNLKWRHKGIFYTEHEPEVSDILDANPVELPSYHYVHKAKKAWQVNSTIFEKNSICDYRYEAQVWETTAVIKNKGPVHLYDVRGAPFQYARTHVVLGGRGDGEDGSRFILHVTAPEGLALEYRAYRTGSADGADLLNRSIAAGLATAPGNFEVVFDLPGLSHERVELVLIPLIVNNGAVSAPPLGTVTLHSLYRLETEDVQVVVGAQAPVETPLPTKATTAAGGLVYHGKTLTDAFTKAATAGATDLEAASSTAFLVQKAIEPQAPLHTKRHYQDFKAPSHQVGARLEIREGSQVARVETAYAWTAAKSPTFTAKITGSTAKEASVIAGATASITQIGANGLATIERLGTGETTEAAVVAAHRGLLTAGNIGELEELVDARPATRRLAAEPQTYFIAAGALAAGLEWHKAWQSDELANKAFHGAVAARIALETIFSLTPTGALLVAVSNLAEYALAQVLPAGFIALLDDGIRSLLGQFTDRQAKQSFAEVAPQIEAFAIANDAAVLYPIKYDKPEQTPLPLAVVGLAILIGLVAWVKRR